MNCSCENDPCTCSSNPEEPFVNKLQQLGLANVREQLGIENEDDLQYIQKEDLLKVGFKPIPANRLLSKIKQPRQGDPKVDDLAELLKKLKVAPSSFYEKNNVKKLLESKVFVHRPEGCHDVIPVEILFEPFAKFSITFLTGTPTKCASVAALKLCETMAQVFDSEPDRGSAGNQVLNNYLEEFVISVARVGTGTSDGSVLNEKHSLLANVEYKNESGQGNGAADLQNDGYFVGQCISLRTTDASLLIDIVGPQMCIRGAVLTEDGIFIDHLTPGIPLLPCYKNRVALEVVARSLLALKETLYALRKFYNSHDSSDYLLAEPWLKKVEIENKKYDVTYVQKVKNKLMWKCSLEHGKNLPPMHACFKFVQKYGLDVHEWCSEKGFAPKLYCKKDISATWQVIIMEWIDGTVLSDGVTVSKELKEEFADNVAQMHNAGFVHGDLRPNNIMLVEEKIYILDFDWSGVVGVLYPAFMNHQEISWPDGAEDGKPIQTEHDLHWVSLMQNEF